MKPLDHVLIIGDHPHAGKTGYILRPFQPYRSDGIFWEVRLDGECLDCAVKENQVMVTK
jgi:hypothetical protein